MDLASERKVLRKQVRKACSSVLSKLRTHSPILPSHRGRVRPIFYRFWVIREIIGEYHRLGAGGGCRLG